MVELLLKSPHLVGEDRGIPVSKNVVEEAIRRNPYIIDKLPEEWKTKEMFQQALFQRGDVINRVNMPMPIDYYLDDEFVNRLKLAKPRTFKNKYR